MNKEAGQMTDRMQGKDAAKRLSILTTAGLIFLMLLYLLLTSYSSTLLAQHTEAISSHPFEVIISAGDVKTYLSEMQIRAERLTKYNSWTDIRLVRNSLDDLYEKIQGPLAIMEAQYLGDPNDVKEIKATLAQLQEELDACVSLASKGTAPELSDYEERRLNPLFGRAEELVDHVIDAAKERKLQYGQTAERLRKQTLIGSVVLVTLMIGGLLLSQYVLRSQRQELLRRSLLFDNLSMNIDDAFLIRDAVTGKVSYTALNIERVLSRPVKRLEDVYEGFLPVDAEQIRRAIADPKFISPYIKNVPYTLTNGEQRWLSVRIYRAKGLEATQIISVFSDCTEEVKSRQALQDAMNNAQRASEAKSVFLSRMSHEIRTPLNAVIGMTTIAAASMHDPAKIQDCLGKISFSSKHLLMLINDILDMSKIESNKMALQKEPFDLFEVVNNFVATLYAQTKEKGIAFTEVMEGFNGQAQYLGDSLRLNQILLNLSSNAVKFTAPGGEIRLSVERIASGDCVDTVRFILTDTGIGMKKEALERIFQPFEQADASIAGRFGGTGLGMSITKNLVSLMDGRLTLQSEAGVGTTCIVDLPFQRGDLADDLPAFSEQGLRALIVDDEQSVCEETAALLEKIRIQSEWVLDGHEAVARVMEARRQNRNFDFCIIDWKMPNMDGIEVAQRIHAQAGPPLPMVMISAYDCSEVEERARKAGIKVFLPKPLYRSAVYAAIESALSPEHIADPNPPADERLKGKRLLVAEDNELNREIMTKLLLMNGIRSESAADGQEALNLFLQSPAGYYDAVLMDVQMPVLNGYEATKRLRACEHPQAKSIPVIATTANAFSDDISAALSAGMNAHVGKPIDFEQLRRVLSELV